MAGMSVRYPTGKNTEKTLFLTYSKCAKNAIDAPLMLKAIMQETSNN